MREAVYCHECGEPFRIAGYERALLRPQLLCARCFYDLTGEDEARREERWDAPPRVEGDPE